MSEERRTPTPAPRIRSAGGRGSQRPGVEGPASGSASEVSGLRRSARRCSDASPATPEPVETKSSRKAGPASCGTTSARSSGSTGTVTTRPDNVDCDTPPGAKLNAHGCMEEDWGMPRARESGVPHNSRVAEHIRGYEEARGSLYRLQEEVREAKALMETAAKRQKAELSARIKQLKNEIRILEKKRTFILENSGPFREKLLNEDRFHTMEREKQRRLRGLQPRVEEEGDAAEADNVEPNPPGGLQHLTPYSGLPAGQVAMSSGRGSGGSGDESSTSHQGGALMAQIQLLESPGRLQDFTFGDELPEEAPGGRKKKLKKTKLQEQRPPGWAEAIGS
ncbi:uncharacterized protein LOC130357279 [Hyla sarda]|uniref:uncharacterized protein LOC130357279 n=1 Tax=Hyla sarda TaxID=327740 RepID=UPI0024C20F71|nr:uncharacterized protein LOC130357279 [Hyla sarda]